MTATGSKNIWILNHYAGTPQQSSTSARHYDIGRELVKKGHRVTIFASGFNHMTFTEECLGKGEQWKAEEFSGVKFIWLKTFPYKGNEWRRIVNMLSYAIRVIFAGRRLKEKPDVIIGSSVHPFAALSAYILASMKKSRFFFEVRDLWPQTLVDMGVLPEKSLFARALYILEKFLYKKAEKIITLLPYAHVYIEKIGIPGEKIFWIPNGADLSRYESVKKYDGAASGVFRIMYLGSHGRANALDCILDCANILKKSEAQSIRFIFVGDGPEKERLMDYAKINDIVNVEFRSPVPKSEIFKVMGEADAFIVSLDDLPLYKYGISLNKLNDYMASGRPVLFSGNSANNPIKEAGAGLSVAALSPELLAKAAFELSRMKPEERIAMGKNGIEYLKKHHDVKLLAAKLESLI